MVTGEILGLHIPDEGTFFYAALAVHVAAGIVAVIAGAITATARKRPGRHPCAGTVYLAGLAVVFVTATAMTAVRPREDAHLFGIALTAAGLGWCGWRARRLPRPGWPRRHAIGTGGSYIALLTGFYVDNGNQLPLWDQLAYWLAPALVGVPLIWWALGRYHAGISTRPPNSR